MGAETEQPLSALAVNNRLELIRELESNAFEDKELRNRAVEELERLAERSFSSREASLARRAVERIIAIDMLESLCSELGE